MGEEILEGEEGEITLEEINNESNNQIEKFEPAILVYPNPGNSVINVVCEGFDLEKNIQIYDLTGKCIWLGNSSEFTETISIDQLAQGLYHLLVTDKKGNRKSCNFQKM
jgi:hypothetical protein